MVEVISEGTPPRKRKYEFPCTKCSSVLRAERHEFKSGSQYTTSYLQIKCPVCCKTIHFEPSSSLDKYEIQIKT